MSDNTLGLLIAAVVAAGLVAVVIYFIVRFLRGTIELSLPRSAYNPGESIIGSFKLHTKKAIQGNQLLVSLIGIEKTRRRKDDGSYETYSEEVYRDDVVVEEARAYSAGYLSNYDFEVTIPEINDSHPINPMVGQALSAVFSMLSQRSVKLDWKLEVRLDARGIDLATSRSISINMGRLH
ncbi:hypothetical protein [Endozoicomonas elysicola]|uniref:Uncharacterized protein n=1 Tax=Endozoicomonas elysicola TaxID=305900 RepID=A0A081KE83_9GAMM|nr:hypothetical protein [Endozoicomonas elysicola]KEI72459.1 hypothetical protein GV64_18535 [Endozoicomonas elysicola]